MALVLTGFAPLDAPHRELERCIRDLGSAVRARDVQELRGRVCLFGEKLVEHFADEESLMCMIGWRRVAAHAEAHARILTDVRRYERRLAVHGLTHDIAYWGLNHLPELMRCHTLVSDFGFGMFALARISAPPTSHASRHLGTLGR